MSASFPRQKFHSALRFPSLFLSSLESFSVLFFGWGLCIVIYINPPQPFVDSSVKSPKLQFTCWVPFAVKWAAMAFSLNCSKFLYRLLALILANPDIALSKHFSACFVQTSQFLSYLYPLEKWFATYFELALHTVMWNFLVYISTCDWLISIFVWKVCLGGLSSCGRTVKSNSCWN